MIEHNFPELTGIVCFNEFQGDVLPPSIKKYTKNPFNYLTPYFETEHLYFLDREVIDEMSKRGQADFGTDYSLMFDTNIASYINKLVKGQSLGRMQSQVVSFIDELLSDNLNFDSNYYMVENAKNLLPLLEIEEPSKIRFWRMLNKSFRENLVSIQIFRSIDRAEYKKTSNPKPIFGYRESVRRAIDFAYDLYGSKDGREHLSHFILVQRLILLQLIGMVRIQLSSNKSAKNKMRQYFEYIHLVVGAYFDRESVIAHKYFSNRHDVPIFNQFQKGMPRKRILKKLDNIAWDMAVPRLMEKNIYSLCVKSEAKFHVPMFLSFDSNLRNVFRHFPVKAAIYSESEGALIPLPKINSQEYFESHGCGKELESLYSEPMKTERMGRPKATKENVHIRIRQQYQELRAVLA